MKQPTVQKQLCWFKTWMFIQGLIVPTLFSGLP